MKNRIVLKNTTQNDIVLTRLGVKINANSDAELNWSEVVDISNDIQLENLITSGDIIVNEGSIDFNTTEAIDYLTLKKDLSNFYTKTESDSIIEERAPTIHDHDDIYYQKSAVDGLIANIETYGVRGSVDNFSNLPMGSIGEVYIVRYSDSINEEGFYRHDGTSWVWLAHNTGTQEHNELSGLNSGDFQHLTSSQKQGLISGNNTSLHHHDNRYYSETEIDALLTQKSDITHNHDSRYYLRGQVDSLINTIDYAKVSANDNNTNITGAQLEQLINGGNADHLHTHSGGGGGGGTGGLDDAYNGHNQWGEGRIINVDYGHVELRATNNFAPLKLQNINYVPTQWLSGGEICFYDEELFYRDSNRAAWLSVSTYVMHGASNQSNVSNEYLLLGPGQSMSSTIGWTAPWDGRICIISFSNDLSSASGNLTIRANGNIIPQGNLWYSGNSSYKNDANGNFNAGDVLSVYVESTSSSQRPHRPVVWFSIRRRIS